MPSLDPDDRDRQLLDSAIPIDTEADVNQDPAGDDLTPIDLSDPALSEDDPGGSKITVFGFKNRAETADRWTRKPNVDGTGATHVKTFVAKLRHDAIHHLDEQVNDWLEAHPECEVKFVTTSVGKLVGKISEDAIFMNVWV